MWLEGASLYDDYWEETTQKEIFVPLLKISDFQEENWVSEQK